MRFERASVVRLVARFQPQIVGISCLHILDVSETLAIAKAIKSLTPEIFVAVGGHAAAAYPAAFSQAQFVDAICAESAEHEL